ncbi:type I methionyl aminopeptidase [Candidatus Microgenomates bacterium]|nr:type I methionyl aminopeptidase [Candidatus Microgenomates bacterium]
MIILKSEEEIGLMIQGGKFLGDILQQVIDAVEPGAATSELDKLAERLLLKTGGEPSFKKVANYQFATCMCVNDVVVHGLPSDYRLQEGDVLGIDIGLLYKGFNTDTAWTVIVGDSKLEKVENKKKIEFLNIGKLALKTAIEQVKVGNHIGDISIAIQEKVEGAGFSVVPTLVGHGVGRKLHEDPQIPGVLTRQIEKTPPLKEGMTLAIEIIYNEGQPEIVSSNKDFWTIRTKDKSLSGLFEKTVAITANGPIVLTI